MFFFFLFPLILVSWFVSRWCIMNAQYAYTEPSTPNISLRPPQLLDPRGIVLLFCVCFVLSCLCTVSFFVCCLLCYDLDFLPEPEKIDIYAAAFRVPGPCMTLNFLSLFLLSLRCTLLFGSLIRHVLHICGCMWLHVWSLCAYRWWWLWLISLMTIHLSDSLAAFYLSLLSQTMPFSPLRWQQSSVCVGLFVSPVPAFLHHRAWGKEFSSPCAFSCFLFRLPVIPAIH